MSKALVPHLPTKDFSLQAIIHLGNTPQDEQHLAWLSIPKGFPGASAGKESACNAGYLGWLPGLERSPGEGKGYPLPYSGLENSTNYIVHGVAESDRIE